MNRFTDLIDLYAICGVALLVERRRLRLFGHQPYVTPVLAFVGSVAIVYLIPLTAALQGYRSAHFLPGRLSEADMHVLASALRIFLYSFFIAYVLLLPALGGSDRERFRRAAPGRANLLRIVIVVILVWTAHLITGVGLSPAALLSRALNPREYTDLRSGSGLVVYLRAAVFLVAFVILGLRIIHDREAGRRIRGPAALFAALVVLDVLGGSKQSVVVGPLVLLFLWGSNVVRMRDSRSADRAPKKAIRTGPAVVRYATVAISVLCLLWVAFGVMQTSEQKASGQTVTDHIISYEQEAFYSARVIQDYQPSQSYALTGVEDVVRGAVPRALFPNKGDVGFFARYWRGRYTPNVVSYQATTFGVLAESHMMFGNAGYVLYGVLFALLMVWMYRLQYARKSWLSICYSAFFIQWMYFIVRGGLLASALLYIVVELVFILVIVKICGLKNSEVQLRARDEDTPLMVPPLPAKGRHVSSESNA